MLNFMHLNDLLNEHIQNALKRRRVSGVMEDVGFKSMGSTGLSVV